MFPNQSINTVMVYNTLDFLLQMNNRVQPKSS